jgi:hypothetical protein
VSFADFCRDSLRQPCLEDGHPRVLCALCEHLSATPEGKMLISLGAGFGTSLAE